MDRERDRPECVITLKPLVRFLGWVADWVGVGSKFVSDYSIHSLG
jgi:hypothetical protein